MPNRLLRTTFPRHGRGRAFTLALLASAAACMFLLPGRGRTARAFDQDLDKLNRFVQGGGTPSMQVFRQARDLIEKEDWAAAAAKFEGYVAQYPKGKETDAALYWLAYALKKQGKFQEAERALERLAGEFPRSSWVDDARAMQVEIAPQVGKKVDPETIDDDELKVVALQSLFESDPARAAAYAAEILKPGSKASRELKETAVDLLGDRGGPGAVPTLLDIARTQPDPELRAVAVHELGQTDDEKVVDELMKIYESERDGDVKEQVLHALSQMSSPRAHARLLEVARGTGDAELRAAAIHQLGQRQGEGVVDELMGIFRAERDEEVRGAVLHALSQQNDPRARAALFEVARTGGEAETRSQAVHALTQFEDEATVAELVRLYDAETDEDVKGALLHAFGDSKQERAFLKLMEVARADASREMRKLAINLLGQSRDPRAVKLLQDLLR